MRDQVGGVLEDESVDEAGCFDQCRCRKRTRDFKSLGVALAIDIFGLDRRCLAISDGVIGRVRAG